MKRAIAVLAFAIALAPAVPCAQQTSAAQSGDSAHALYHEGRERLAAGDYTGALKSLYASLEKLRAEGRGATPDAGLVAGYLATALEKLDHPQAEQAWLLAFNLLERAASPDRFIEAASALLRRMNTADKAKEADRIIARLAQRIEVEGVSDSARIEALNAAMAYYRGNDRKSDGDALMMAHAVRLNGETEEALEIRGIARLRRAHDAYRDGKLADFENEIEAAILDLRRTLPKTARDLGAALALTAKMRMKEGAYVRALSAAEEAAIILEGSQADARDQEARILQIRILERLGRGREALELSRELSARYAQYDKQDANHAALLRLFVVEMMTANGRLSEARAMLMQEYVALSTFQDEFALGLYYDRLAGLELAESNFPAAAKAAELALATKRRARPHEKAHLLESMRKRASATDGLPDRAYGEQAHRELIELSSVLFHDMHPEFAHDLDIYASFLEAEGRREEAYDLRRRSVAALERAYGREGVKVAYALNNLAVLLGSAGLSEDAVEALERAIAIIGQTPEFASRRILMRANLANWLADLGRPEEAMAEIQRARDELPGSEAEVERLSATIEMVEMMALDAMGRTEEAYRKGEAVVAHTRAGAREAAANLLAVHVKMAQLAQKMGDDQKALMATALGFDMLARDRIETNARWRALAETALPSLWRVGQN